MYGLLNVRGINFGNVKILTKPVDSLVNFYLCSFCKFYHQHIFKPQRYQQLKHYSTTANPSELRILSPKKMKRKITKYLKLLEVQNATKNKRAKVKQLNAANLSEFVDNDNKKDIEKNFKNRHNLRKEELVRGIRAWEEDVTDKNSLLSKVELLQNRKKNIEEEELRIRKESTLKERAKLIVRNEREKLIKAQIKLLNEKERKKKKNENISEENVNKFNFVENDYDSPDESIIKISKPILSEEESLEEAILTRQEHCISFFQTCINCGKLKQAFDTFIKYKKKTLPVHQHCFNNKRIHNLFLREFAHIGDIDNVILIRNLMMENSIEMTPESYASIFECVSRTENPSNQIELLRSVKKQMNEDSINFNDIVTRPLFVRDQLKMVLHGIQILDNYFIPHFPKKQTNYRNHLLDDIYVNRNFKSPAEGLFVISDLRERTMKQLQVENAGDVEIKSIAANVELTEKAQKSRKKLSELNEFWRLEIRKGFDRSLEALNAKQRGLQLSHLTPYLTVLEPDDYVNAMMNEVKNLAESAELFSPPLGYLARNLAANIFKKYENKIQQKEGIIDNILKCYDDYCKWYLEGGKEENGRIKWQHLEYELKKHGNCSMSPVMQWPSVVMRNVGRFLYDIILKDLKFTVPCKNGKELLLPAFYITFRSKYKQVKEEIKPHPLLTKLYQNCNSEILTFNYSTLPSLSPPRPWNNIDEGGYLINKTGLVRIPYGYMDQLRRIKSRPKMSMYPLLDCVNQLGSIPWKVNTSILDVAMKVFQEGGSEKLNVPEPPSILPEASLATPEMSADERIEMVRNRALLKKRKNEMYSLWCDALYKLSLANHYRDEIFWLPHNMDFRGRVYPIPPHLSHIGSDFARSMLIFAQKKPLGEKGLDWLKIHLINLTGFKKKESIKTRLHYANKVIDKILDSAEKPLTGEMWWATSDEPWQTLAACMEISKALKSQNPNKYLTGFPVHQDGSCNGLQHYAALGRDQFGAESVNLFPFEKPRDVYSDIVVLVEKTRQADAEKGLEIAQILKGHIQRKVIKQTIMTTVYGVTRFGARLQINKQLKDLKDFPEDKVWQGSSYLVDKTFESLRTMFKSAKEIQDWFTECAKLICTLREAPVEWETPLGLPVIQPYFKISAKLGKTPFALKQKNAFPPNFIHSLDSTHMMLTSLFCEQAGITFMSVHDCFWTHPSTVSKMNEICRKQFIALHSEPLLENLSQYLLNRFQFSEEDIMNSPKMKIAETYEKMNYILAQVPSKGTYDLKNIQSSTYFFC